MPPDAPAAAGAAPGASVPSAAPATAKSSTREASKAANRAAALTALAKGPAAAAAEVADVAAPPAKAAAPERPAPHDPHAEARKAASERYAARIKEQSARSKQKQAEATEKARRDAEAASWTAKVEASKADIQRAELAKADPFAYLESLGVTASQLVERGIKRGSPEAAAEARIAAAEAKANELVAWKEDFLKQQIERETTTKQQNFERAVIQEKRDMVAVVFAAPEKFPHIEGWPEDYLGDRAYRAGKEYYDTYGEVPLREDVLKALDSAEGKRKASRQQGSTAGAASVASGAQASTQAKAAGTARTLTGSHGKTSQSPRSNARASMAEKKAAAVAAMSRATR